MLCFADVQDYSVSRKLRVGCSLAKLHISVSSVLFWLNFYNDNLNDYSRFADRQRIPFTCMSPVCCVPL